MPGWLTGLLKWGGYTVTIISVIAVVYVEVVAPPPEGSESGAPVTLYWVLIAGGLAAAIAGWLLERRKGSSGS
jgi:hypothetical protein